MKIITSRPSKMITFYNIQALKNDNLYVIIFEALGVIFLYKSANVIILGCYHLCYHLVLSFILCCHLMLSFLKVWKCYHFCVKIFPCTGWELSFMFSFNVIIFCYHFPPFFFVPENVTHSLYNEREGTTTKQLNMTR